MTTDEINRAIAERCGWKTLHAIPRGHAMYPPNLPPQANVLGHTIPNYCASLDALHEALNSLDDSELRRYADEVCELAYDGTTGPDIQQLLTMEAAELAACYVRAIGKWRGE